jgi:hypothetical protein
MLIIDELAGAADGPRFMVAFEVPVPETLGRIFTDWLLAVLACGPILTEYEPVVAVGPMLSVPAVVLMSPPFTEISPGNVVVAAEAPIDRVVAAPPIFIVRALALKRDTVPVLVVVMDGDAPLRASDVTRVPVIVGFAIVKVPVEAPMLIAVAAPAMLNVVALVFIRLNVV